MDHATARLAPKVHPLARPVEPEDPFTLNATSVGGDPEVMIRAVVQEYAWLGWSADQIISLFRDPFFPVLYSLWQTLGDAELRKRIASLTEAFGIFRFQSTMVESPDGVDTESFEDLVLENNPPAGMPEDGFQESPSACRQSRDLPFVSLGVLTDRSRRPEGGHHE